MQVNVLCMFFINSEVIYVGHRFISRFFINPEAVYMETFVGVPGVR